MKRGVIMICLILMVFMSFGNHQSMYQKDFSIFKDIFYTTHPNLYQYHTEKEIDSLFEKTANEISKISNNKEYFKLLQEIIAFIKDGHTQLYSEQLLTKGIHTPTFPFLVKIINHQLVVDYSIYTSIKEGTVITKINGESVVTIFEKLEKYVVVDGYATLERKSRMLEKNFHYFYYLEFGEVKKFEIEYYQDNQLDVIQEIFSSKPYHWHTQNEKKRVSHFSNFAKNTQQKPFVKFVDSLQTAILTINTFNQSLSVYEKQIDAIFEEIHERKISNLVIDLRRNSGGYRKASLYLFSYLAKQEFVQRENALLKNLDLPYQNHIIHTSYNASIIKKNVSHEAKKLDDVFEKDMKPHKNSFKGKVYVLVSGQTFSAAASFATLAYNHGFMVIGEETSGGYYHYSSDFFVIYQLPHTKMNVSFFLTQVTANVEAQHKAHGSGVQPHVEVKFSIQDLKNKKDVQLCFILKQLYRQIKQSSSPMIANY